MANGYDVQGEAFSSSRVVPIDRRRHPWRRQRNGYASNPLLSAPRPVKREAQHPLSKLAPPRDTLTENVGRGAHPGRRGFPGEREARMALAIASQFADSEVIAALQKAVADTYGTGSSTSPVEEPPTEEEPSMEMAEALLPSRR